MKNLIFLLPFCFLIYSCRSIPQEEIITKRTQLKPISDKQFNNSGIYEFKILSKNSLIINNKNGEISYLILLDSYENIDKLKIKDEIYLNVYYQKDYLILNNRNLSIAFSINDIKYSQKNQVLNDLKNNVQIFDVIGITKIYGKEKIQLVNRMTEYDVRSRGDFPDNPEYPDGYGGSGMTCTSGGKGAVHCAVSSGLGTVNTGCEVTCKSGYYACCDDGNSICKCIKE